MSENKKSFFKDKARNNVNNKEGKQGKSSKKWGKNGTQKKDGAKSGSAKSFGAKSGGAKSFGTKSAGTESAGAKAGGVKKSWSKNSMVKGDGLKSGSTKSFGAKSGSAKSFGAKSGSAKSFGAKSAGAKTSAAKNSVAKNNAAKAKVKKAVPSISSQWYYFCPQEISVSEIRDCLQDQKITMDIWKEAGVLTLDLGEKKNVDFEEREASFGNDKDDAFLQELNTKALFDISMTPGVYELCQPYFQMIVDKLGGCFCADTEDFQPRIG